MEFNRGLLFFRAVTQVQNRLEMSERWAGARWMTPPSSPTYHSLLTRSRRTSGVTQHLAEEWRYRGNVRGEIRTSASLLDKSDWGADCDYPAGTHKKWISEWGLIECKRTRTYVLVITYILYRDDNAITQFNYMYNLLQNVFVTLQGSKVIAYMGKTRHLTIDF